MILRRFDGTVGAGCSVSVTTYRVKEGTSIVFLTPSVINPVVYARFYDGDDVVHQVPVEAIVSIDPDPPELRLPVRYLDPATGEEVRR